MNYKLKSRTLWLNVLWFVASFVLCYTDHMEGWVAALSMGGAAGAYTVSSLLKVWLQIKNNITLFK